MGLFGRYPFALAAGLGLNAFAAAEVAAHRVSWPGMMGIFVIDGLVIVALVVPGLSERIIDAIPFDLKLAIGIGIGAFITVVGLKNAGFVISGGRSRDAELASRYLEDPRLHAHAAGHVDAVPARSPGGAADRDPRTTILAT